MLLKNEQGAAPERVHEEGRGGRPARRHPLHRLVLGQAALPRSPRSDGITASSAATVDQQRGRRPDRAQDATTGEIRHRGHRRPGAAPHGDARPRRARPRSSTSSTGARASSPCAASPTASTSATTGRPSSTTRTSPPAGSCSSSSSSSAQADGTYAPPVRRIRDRASPGGRPGRLPRRGRPTARSACVGRRAATHFTKEIVRSGIDEAVAAAKGADVAVVVVGSMPFINGREAHDRTDIGLAAGQEALVKAVRKANPNTVVVLENSYPTTIDAAPGEGPGDPVDHPRRAGDRPRPRRRPVRRRQPGRPSHPDLVPVDRRPARHPRLRHHQDRLAPTCTSRDAPLYAFGHGLSYTTFRYQGLKAVAKGDGYEVTVA